MKEQYGIGLGLRLTSSELRRLDVLAKATGRTRSAVVRGLLRLASARDVDGLQLLRESLTTLQKEDADGRS